MDRNKIIVFVKNEVKGKVKTRLAKTVGDDKALEAYQELLKITRDQLVKINAKKEVWYSWSIPSNDLWDNDRFEKKLQIEGDLGSKMKNAFSEAFEDGFERVVLIGSDCPGLRSSILDKALIALKDNDLVFGSSEDGGYYLIGMSSYTPEVLSDIDWSTERVMKQTEERAKQQFKSIKKLTTLYDIDTEKDWDRFKSEST